MAAICLGLSVLNEISLKYVPYVIIHKMAALIQIMAWRRTGGKPLSQPTGV